MQRKNAVIEMGAHYLRAGFSIEGMDSGEGVVVNAAHGIEVGARIQLHALELLGCHEKNGAEDRILLVDGLQRGFGGELGESEIDNLDLEFPRGQPGQHDVGGLEIAVNEIHVLCCDQGLLCLQGEFAEVVPRENGFFHDIIHCPAVKKFHHHEGAILVDADIVDRHDVRMLQGGESACFFRELHGGFAIRLAAVLREDALDGDFSVENFVMSTIDSAKSALADFSANFVAFLHSGQR